MARGCYGTPPPPPPRPAKSAWKTFAIGGAILVAIVLLSPGARHYYRHGELPPCGNDGS